MRDMQVNAGSSGYVHYLFQSAFDEIALAAHMYDEESTGCGDRTAELDQFFLCAVTTRRINQSGRDSGRSFYQGFLDQLNHLFDFGLRCRSVVRSDHAVSDSA